MSRQSFVRSENADRATSTYIDMQQVNNKINILSLLRGFSFIQGGFGTLVEGQLF